LLIRRELQKFKKIKKNIFMNPGKVDKKIDAISFAVYFVGWVKLDTAYPAKAAFWMPRFFLVSL